MNRRRPATPVKPTGDAPFWRRKRLAEMTGAEWESLCDGCGLCCLQKLEDADDGSVYYTRVACKLLDLQSCNCSRYAERLQHVPDCLQLTPDAVPTLDWLPATCAYRLVDAGEELPPWHHLVCGDRRAVHRAGISQAGRMIGENTIASDRWADHVIFRRG